VSSLRLKEECGEHVETSSPRLVRSARAADDESVYNMPEPAYKDRICVLRVLWRDIKICIGRGA